jgi:hypothetical protein
VPVFAELMSQGYERLNISTTAYDLYDNIEFDWNGLETICCKAFRIRRWLIFEIRRVRSSIED